MGIGLSDVGGPPYAVTGARGGTCVALGRGGGALGAALVTGGALADAAAEGDASTVAVGTEAASIGGPPDVVTDSR